MDWYPVDHRSSNHSHQSPGFSFEYLWPIALAINQSDPRNASLYHPHDNQSRLTLTYDACIGLVGTDYTNYSRGDVYDRVLLWRVPLIALLATTTLPALGLWTQVFTILHVLADPIDSFWSLFYKLDLARRHAQWALSHDESNKSKFTFNPKLEGQSTGASTDAVDDEEELSGIQPLEQHRQTDLKGRKDKQGKEQRLRDANSKLIKDYDIDTIALIVNAYEEWHLGQLAKDAIENGFDRVKWSTQRRANFRSRCHSAAAYLAADRVYRDLPSWISTAVFLVQLSAGFWKTLENIGDQPDPTNPTSIGINRTPHNIAFGSLFFWLPFAVLSTAFVGGAQTENSVPRILNRLREDTKELFKHDGKTPNQMAGDIPDFPELDYSMPQRRLQGGLPIWQLDKANDWDNGHAKFFIFGGVFLSLVIVGIPTATAVWLSWRTPTEGFGCRAITQICFFLAWVFSHICDWILVMAIKEPSDPLPVRGQSIFWITLGKDAILGGGAVIMLTFSAVGIFNSCNCWTKWWPDLGQRYLSFPEEQFVFDTIKHRLGREFPIVTAVALGLELVIFIFVTWAFWSGHCVLRQRDIDAVLKESVPRMERIKKRVRETLGRRHSRQNTDEKRIVDENNYKMKHLSPPAVPDNPESPKRTGRSRPVVQHSDTIESQRGASRDSLRPRSSSSVDSASPSPKPTSPLIPPSPDHSRTKSSSKKGVHFEPTVAGALQNEDVAPHAI